MELKPEEFQILYKAYQAALGQAKNAEKRENIRAFPTEEKREEPYLEFNDLEWRFSTFSWDMEDRERVEIPGAVER